MRALTRAGPLSCYYFLLPATLFTSNCLRVNRQTHKHSHRRPTELRPIEGTRGPAGQPKDGQIQEDTLREESLMPIHVLFASYFLSLYFRAISNTASFLLHSFFLSGSLIHKHSDNTSLINEQSWTKQVLSQSESG